MMNWKFYTIVCWNGTITSYTVDFQVWATDLQDAFKSARMIGLTPFAVR
jgi:hypothetical protein